MLKEINRPELRLESYMGTPMLVLYYGPGHKYNLRLTKKKIELLEAYLPIAHDFVKAVESKKLEEFKKDLEALGYKQVPITPDVAAPAVVAEPRPKQPVFSEDEVAF